jgi:hypothetical protein
MPHKPSAAMSRRVLPASGLKVVTLQLARRRGLPAGDLDCGYIFVAPLDDQGRLDLRYWDRHRDSCGVVRFWANSRSLNGRLRHRKGPDGLVWFFDFDATSEVDDRVGYRLDEHRFVPGEYVTLTDATGSDVLRVMSVDAINGVETHVSAAPIAQAMEAEAGVGYDPRIE